MPAWNGIQGHVTFVFPELFGVVLPKSHLVYRIKFLKFVQGSNAPIQWVAAHTEGRVEDGPGSLGHSATPVSHPRSSNRTCRSPASGSHIVGRESCIVWRRRKTRRKRKRLRFKFRGSSTLAHDWYVAKDIATAAGVTCDLVHLEHEQPSQAIIDTAQNRGCDAIQMASHGRRGISAMLLGSETLKVLNPLQRHRFKIAAALR
jgi:Universal stress protein family